MFDFGHPLLDNQLFQFIVLLWSITWKGLGLWYASRNKQKYWFAGLLVINSLGLLEIIFLTWFVKKDRFWDKMIKRQAWTRSKSSSTKRT